MQPRRVRLAAWLYMSILSDNVETIDQLRARWNRIGADEQFWQQVEQIRDTARQEHDALTTLRKIAERIGRGK